MKKFRCTVLALLCLLAAAASLSAAPASGSPPPAPAVAQPLPWELAGDACAEATAAGDSTLQVPIQKPLFCFCFEDHGYCKRVYGPGWFCNTDPCQCEPI